ncbi:Protein of unknown function [Pseudarcicella hirudinis]|uniref:DUF2029 domain-containing protein n=1 Tax=Pseudarcicella hirudinis TaxID=1079859 RepID=A0A1I5QCG5_9BACT|nr:glycosyltransferase family 87 protein [Pseudarcicella hirudinis]SFP43999.1 Protein of unknown function [Pseudarcicella hirudinis]
MTYDFKHFLNKRNIIVIWFLAGLIIGLKQYSLGEVNSHINNYIIFKTSFKHLLEHKNLYLEYPKEYFDLFLYGAIFPILIAPLAVLPTIIGVSLWSIINSLFLLYAIYQLPVSEKNKAIISWIVLNCSITAMLNTQFHNISAAMIILSYTQLKKKNEFAATAFMVLGTMIKLYGIVGLAFFFFSENKVKYIAYSILWAFIFFITPMFFVGIDYTLQCYADWYNVLAHKNDLNIDLLNTRTDVCVMGFFRRILNDGSLSNLYFIIPGVLILGSSYLKIRAFKNPVFQMRLLASVLLFVILASTGSESPTMVIGFVGVAIWYILSKKTTFDTFLLWFALIITSFSPTDIFPKFIRNEYINRYALMVIPLLFVWLKLHWEILLKTESLEQETLD